MSRKPYQFLFFIITAGQLITGCSKGTTSPDFSYSGSTFIGDSISFSSNMPLRSPLWTFGDGDSSTATSPIHVYRKKGNYQVTLYYTGTAGNKTIQKSLPIATGAARLAGTYKWSWYYYYSALGHTYTNYFPDTTFSIVAINDTTIQVGTQVLQLYTGYYAYFDTTNILFSASDLRPYGFPGLSLNYNYATDSLYLMNNGSGNGGTSYYLYYAKK